MCKQSSTRAERVALMRCGHGTFHLTVGDTTLHLDKQELALVGTAIQKWLGRHPEVLKALDEAGMIHTDGSDTPRPT